jgi:hypothetical protein
LLGADQRCGILAESERRKTAKTNRKALAKNNLRSLARVGAAIIGSVTTGLQGKFTASGVALAQRWHCWQIIRA